MNTKQITDFFNTLGIGPNLKGYPYLVHLVGLSMDCADGNVPQIKDLYKMTGEHFGVSADNVNNNVRTVLRKYWNQENAVSFFQLTHYKNTGSLPAKEFIYVTAAYLMQHL